MSLTEEALYQRTWGSFPQLARLLDRKELGPEWTGYSSASDNTFAKIDRHLNMYALIIENEHEITQAIYRIGIPLRDELADLAQELEAIAVKFSRAARFTDDLAHRH